MIIREMSEAECRKALAEASLGRLACSRDNRPYVIPTYFAFDGTHIYAFSTLGQKIEWMRSNPHVCLEIEERLSHSRWMSVIVFGFYEELRDEPEFEVARRQAQDVLQRRKMWWEPAIVDGSHRDTPRAFTPVIYRIHIERMTGHCAAPEIAQTSIVEAPKENWWNDVMRCFRGTKL